MVAAAPDPVHGWTGVAQDHASGDVRVFMPRARSGDHAVWLLRFFWRGKDQTSTAAARRTCVGYDDLSSAGIADCSADSACVAAPHLHSLRALLGHCSLRWCGSSGRRDPTAATRLVDDEESCTLDRVRAMRRIAIADVIALVRSKREAFTVLQFDFERAGQAVENVSLGTPVVGVVSGGVVEDAHPNIAKVTGAPKSVAGFAGMRSGLDGAPVSDGHGTGGHVHGGSVEHDA